MSRILSSIRAKMELAQQNKDLKGFAHLHQMLVDARRDTIQAYRKLMRNKSATVKLSDKTKQSVVQTYPSKGKALFQNKHNGKRKVMPYFINSYQNNNPKTRS